MPAKKRNLKAPKASRKKRLIHAFYLMQPFLQFFALVAVLIVFARCSPLASSTDKNSKLKSDSATALEHISAEAAEAQAREELIQKKMKEVATEDLSVISESEFKKIAEKSIRAEIPCNENCVIDQIDHRAAKPLLGTKKRPKLLSFSLREENRAALFEHGYLRLDLSERLDDNLTSKAKLRLFKEFERSLENLDLGATGYLVLPDNAMSQAGSAFKDLNLQLRISLSVISDEKAYIEIRVLEEESANSQMNAVLLDEAAAHQGALAIVLE